MFLLVLRLYPLFASAHSSSFSFIFAVETWTCKSVKSKTSYEETKCCLLSRLCPSGHKSTKPGLQKSMTKESQLSVSVSMISHPGNHRKFVRFTKINFSDFQWTRFARLTWVLNRSPVTEAHRRLASPAGTEPDWRFRRQKFTTTSLTLFNIQRSTSWRINLNVWQGWILSLHHSCQHRSSRLIQIQTWASGIIMFVLGVVPAEQSLCSCCHVSVVLLKLNASLCSLQCFLAMRWNEEHEAEPQQHDCGLWN